MALQGTIDTFPLTDVLSLLANSHKTGRLVLEGNRGTATLWIEDGQVHGGGPAPAASAAELVFALLRFSEGSFTFDAPAADEEPVVGVEPTGLVECVREAEVLRQEWSAIEQVVPSLAHRVRLVPELRNDTVTLDAAAWELVVAAGPTPTIAELTEELGRGEFDTARGVAELLAGGLVEVVEPSKELDLISPAPSPERIADTAEPAPVDPAPVMASADTFESAASPFPDRFPIDDLVGSDGAGDDGSWGEESARPADEHEVVTSPAFAGANDSWDRLIDDALDSEEPAAAANTAPEDSTDEVLRQMSRLSPQAAEAIAAALNTGQGATSSNDEPEAPASFLGSF